MDKNEIRKAQISDFEAISRLIVSQNRNPVTRCIHSDNGENDQSILSEIIRLDAIPEIVFVVSERGETLNGILGCEFDEELGRGWVRGPFIVNEGDWSEEAALLYEGLLNQLSPSIHQLDTFLDIQNKLGNEFFLSRDFKQLRLVHVYAAAASERIIQSYAFCEPIRPDHAQSFIDLHQMTFPNTYITGQKILDKLGDQQQVFVYGDGDETLGYIYALVNEDTGEGSIEFVGVKESGRGKGIGRKLLQTALSWLFEVKKVPQVILVVNDDLANARSLYESAGFRLQYTGVHNRKNW